MTFSELASGTVSASGKFTSRYGMGIQYLVVHHWAGIGGGDSRLIDPNAEVSCNYILYSSGSLIGQVPEEYRAWTSGSWAADAPGITVETQNTSGAPAWQVSAAAVEMLARLAADLCVRYLWGTVDRTRVRGHREFAATACPGPYLWSLLDAIVARANEILVGEVFPPAPVWRDETMLGIKINDGENRYSKDGGTLFATIEGGSFVQLAVADANSVAGSLRRDFANVTYQAWEAYYLGAERRVLLPGTPAPKN